MIRLVALSAALLLLVGAEDCKRREQTFTMRDGQKAIGNEERPSFAFHTSPSLPGGAPNDLDLFCTDEQKIICEWSGDPNSPRTFEYTQGTKLHDFGANGPQTVENLVRCAQATTYSGICEDWHDIVGPSRRAIAAVSSVDIGACSSSLPTKFLANMIATEFQKQADNRQGNQAGPAGEDVLLWLDFVIGLKPGDWPAEMFFDWTIDDYNAMTAAVVLRLSNYVDGDIKWGFDPGWLGDFPGSNFFSATLSGLIYSNPLGWLAMAFGNCDKDRPMTTEVRGTFVATKDRRGIGLRVDERATCGPNFDKLCTSTVVYPWPARPICNNKIKPKIEAGFRDALIKGFADPAGGVRCLTCTADGGSLLPFQSTQIYPGEPLPVSRVVVAGPKTHFVHLEDRDQDLALFIELTNRGLCGLDRAVRLESLVLLEGGEQL